MGASGEAQTIAKTQSLIAAGDIVGAESALVELADAEGDRALMVVLVRTSSKGITPIPMKSMQRCAPQSSLYLHPILLQDHGLPRLCWRTKVLPTSKRSAN